MIRTTLPFRCLTAQLLFVLAALPWCAAEEIDTSRGDRMIAAYFSEETAALRDGCLADIDSLEQWEQHRPEYRRQLLEMLGLDPWPEKTDLQAEITGTAEHEEFIVENLVFQSRPGLYVTGNLYVPNQIDKPLPAILYVCGHGRVRINGVDYGNKVHYQHHGAWFARNGYVCLTIDTLQLGEIEGIHHGTYRYDMWWWLNRGYTPAGVEAWNCVRALDYLQSRKEVDPDRLGVTGRSGGGAYSWWIAAIDDRIKAAVPVAGITDLENHVVDGCVEGHCDCMYMVNTYRWDYAKVAALVAPRPLLISNTDRDRIFPLEGVVRTHAQVRKIYELYGAADKLALQITAGPHQDTQELRVHAFRWFNQHLKNKNDLIEKTAVKFFDPPALKVFDELPADQLNTKIHETFVPRAEHNSPPADAGDWQQQSERWKTLLLEKSFRGWPAEAEPLNVERAFSVERQGVHFQAFDFTSQGPVRLRLYVAQRAGLEKPSLTVLNVLDEPAWREFLASMRVAFAPELKDESLPEADERAFAETAKMFENFAWSMAYVAPRGIGPTAWDQSERKQTQHRRRFYLLGQTLDAMRVWDIRRAVQAVQSEALSHGEPVWLQSWRTMAGNTLYASIFEPSVARLDLYELSATHRDGPIFLNVARFLDMPQAVALAAGQTPTVIYSDDSSVFKYASQVAEKLAWSKKQLQFRKPPAEPEDEQRDAKKPSVTP